MLRSQLAARRLVTRTWADFGASVCASRQEGKSRYHGGQREGFSSGGSSTGRIAMSLLSAGESCKHKPSASQPDPKEQPQEKSLGSQDSLEMVSFSSIQTLSKFMHQRGLGDRKLWPIWSLASRMTLMMTLSPAHHGRWKLEILPFLVRWMTSTLSL
jgi:hypothetical protein